jgi:simple sugar transport system ATP-binding protein
MSKAETRQILLETKGISKKFPKVLANDNVSITLRDREILSLLGENGAGKSTLMNILYGLYRPTAGTILLEGREVQFPSPKDAIRQGLGMVHQHFMLVDTLTVTENIILGTEPGRLGFVDTRKARQEVAALSERYNLVVDPDARIESLSVGLQQRVEILKALYRRARILILDEPTAVLTPQEVDQLFTVIRTLRDSGVSLIIITHKLEEAKKISERVYVLRRGKVAGERETDSVSQQELANLMVGRDVVLTVHKKARRTEADPAFILKDLHVRGDKGKDAVAGVSLEVRPGEVVGIAGVDGNGQSEIAEAIMGLREASNGRVLFKGQELTHLRTHQRIMRKISSVPADRQRFGLVLPMKLSENTILGYHTLKPFAKGISQDLEAVRRHAEVLVARFDIRTPGVELPAGHLSGGNQQKLILAREFSRDPEFLLVNQPTRGLDVGAIEYIHSQVLAMSDRKVAILLISLELEEIFALSDRILVLYEGRIVKELDPSVSSEEEVGFYMTGGEARWQKHGA